MVQKIIAVLPGDGIGPEIMAEAIKVLDVIADEHDHNFIYHEADFGGVAKSLARIYYRNSVNGGRMILPLESYEDLSVVTETGQELEINLGEKTIINLTNNRTYKIKPFGPVIEILEAGGLTEYNKRKLNL